MPAYQFTEHGAEIGGDLQIPSLEELFRFESRPRPIYLSTADRTSEHKHDIAMAVVRAVVAIFGGGPAKLRHRDDHDVFHAVSHIAGEGSQGTPELREELRQLPILVAVMIPSPDFRKGGFQTCIRFDESGDLSHSVTEFSLILGAIWRAVGSPIDGLDHLYRFEGALALSSELSVLG